jgi:hypothetical protein
MPGSIFGGSQLLGTGRRKVPTMNSEMALVTGGLLSAGVPVAPSGQCPAEPQRTANRLKGF